MTGGVFYVRGFLIINPSGSIHLHRTFNINYINTFNTVYRRNPRQIIIC